MKGPHSVTVFGQGPEDGPKARAFGKAIVIGPDGQKREFNFGDGEGGAFGGKMKTFRFDGGGAPQGMGGKMKVFRLDGDEAARGMGGKMKTFRFDDGDGDAKGGKFKVFRMDGEGGEDGEGANVIRLRRGPGAQGGEPRIEIQGLDHGAGHAHGGSAAVKGHIVIVGPDGKTQEFDFGGDDGPGFEVRRFKVPAHRMEFRDGEPGADHLWEVQGDDEPAPARMKVRRPLGEVI
jgi:hypothetical protein